MIHRLQKAMHLAIDNSYCFGMKLLILLITSALLGYSLASPLERQELVDEVLEALAQESNERELADIESNRLVDAESDNELADVDDDDEELEDEANEQELDSVLEALAAQMTGLESEKLADIEKGSKKKRGGSKRSKNKAKLGGRKRSENNRGSRGSMNKGGSKGRGSGNKGQSSNYRKAKKIVNYLLKYYKYLKCIKKYKEEVETQSTTSMVTCVAKKLAG